MTTKKSEADGSIVEPPTEREQRPPRENPEQAVAADLNAVREAFGAWHAAAARSTEACHRVLGEIFVRAGQANESPERKSALAALVATHPEVAASSRYDPYQKDAAELHLTAVFGLKNRRNVKSYWRTALRAAERQLKEGVIASRSVDAFVAWFGAVGMEGAQRIVLGQSGSKAEFRITSFDEEEGEEIDLPAAIPAKENLPHGLVSILVRPVSGGARKGKFLGYATTKSALAWTVAGVEQQRRRDAREFQEEVLKAVEARNDGNVTPDLLIPKRFRAELDGRVHFIDEDERIEFFRDRKLDRDWTRKRTRGRKRILTKREATRKVATRKRNGKSALPIPPEVGFEFFEWK